MKTILITNCLILSFLTFGQKTETGSNTVQLPAQEKKVERGVIYASELRLKKIEMKPGLVLEAPKPKKVLKTGDK